MFKFVAPRFIFKVERWKWNDEFRVYVSNMGHFMDEHKKIIPIKIAEGGYVGIYTNYGWVFAHRLVMKTWRPTANMESLTVDHLDHNKRNNSVENLEWVTRAENLARAEADYIPCLVKNKNKEQKADARKKMKRYNRMDYTLDDMTFGVDGTFYPTLEEAHAVASIILQEKVKGFIPEEFQIKFMENKYQTLINRCKCKDKKVIDGITTLCYFKHLKLAVKVKPQEDEV